jgi:hypothetical protein
VSVQDLKDDEFEDPAGVEAPPSPLPGMGFEADLTQLCMAAAWIGVDAGSSEPISYTTLLLAFLGGSDRVSRWFQECVQKESIPWKTIAAERSATPESIERCFAQARTGEMPPLESLYSDSVLEVLTRAAELLRQVTDERPPYRLGCRHVLAAYAFRTSSVHLEQLQRWKLESRPGGAARSLTF